MSDDEIEELIHYIADSLNIIAKNKKIIEYVGIAAPNVHAFDLKINEYIELGWQPYGNVIVSNGSFYQSMVKYGFYD